MKLFEFIANRLMYVSFITNLFANIFFYYYFIATETVILQMINQIGLLYI